MGTPLSATTGNDTVNLFINIRGQINGGARTAFSGVDLDGLGGTDVLVVDDNWRTSHFTLTTNGDGIVTLATASGSFTFKNFESIQFTNVTINLGTAAADTITGSRAADGFLFGMDGNDTIDGGAGIDSMYGGAGDDVYIVDTSGDVVVEDANGGTDTVNSSMDYSLVDTDGNGSRGSGVENLTLTGTAAVNATGNALNNVLTGNSAANVLLGDAGNDTLSGAGGLDSLTGGLGNDTYIVGAAGTVITETAGEGMDTVKSSMTYSLKDTDGAGALGGNIENLTLTGTAAINATGNAFGNVLIGNAGANVITGGAGRDVMTGGAGRDIFDFNAVTDTTKVVATRDIITDFKHLTDRIDLSTIDANGTKAGNGAFVLQAKLGAAFTGVSGQLHFANAGANTLVSGDINGDKVADFHILVNGHIALTAADFIL